MLHTKFLCLIAVALNLTGCFTMNLVASRENSTLTSVKEWSKFILVDSDLYLEFQGKEAFQHDDVALRHAVIPNITSANSDTALIPKSGAIDLNVAGTGKELTFKGPRERRSTYPLVSDGERIAIYGTMIEPKIDIAIAVPQQSDPLVVSVSGWYSVADPHKTRSFYVKLPLAIVADAVTAPVQLLGVLVLVGSIATGSDLRVTGL